MKVFGQVISHPVKVLDLGSGNKVTYSTLILMKDLINKSVRNYYVRRWAEKIIERSGDTDFLRAKAVYDFLNFRVKYVKDPEGLELIKSPIVSLQLLDAGEIPSLDCDDMVVLALSLLKSIGFRVGMRAVSYTPEKVYTHVYGLVYVKPDGWYPFDLVKHLGFGREAPLTKYHYIDIEV
ncbi:MAG: transglutaminase-like domain-containing protein [Roseiflexus sp.]|uniref:transglutaminase-like domain-containing protein n=1 Tax=Roseiflexus sp. TaxID=2562120 RepID=UPI0025CBAFBD|nr:transglutaminase-like domain-containing protein [Roseiflexus sp.]MCL6542088.1 transglutaminase-like domain-containing protein [Roseiflexus sp.]